MEEVRGQVETLEAEVQQMSNENGVPLTDARAEQANEMSGSVDGGLGEDMTRKLEERSAKFVNIPPPTSSDATIESVVRNLKEALEGHEAMPAPTVEALRPGVDTIVKQAGENGLGVSVREFSSAMADAVEAVHDKLPKDRVALMTTADIPELLRDTVAKMNEVKKTTKHLRQRLAAIIDLSNQEIGRVGATSRSRAHGGHTVRVIGGNSSSEPTEKAQGDAEALQLPTSVSSVASPRFADSLARALAALSPAAAASLRRSASAAGLSSNAHAARPGRRLRAVASFL